MSVLVHPDKVWGLGARAGQPRRKGCVRRSSRGDASQRGTADQDGRLPQIAPRLHEAGAAAARSMPSRNSARHSAARPCDVWGLPACYRDRQCQVPGDEARQAFEQLNQAYRELRDPDKLVSVPGRQRSRPRSSCPFNQDGQQLLQRHPVYRPLPACT
jgi:hypothetical protein